MFWLFVIDFIAWVVIIVSISFVLVAQRLILIVVPIAAFHRHTLWHFRIIVKIRWVEAIESGRRRRNHSSSSIVTIHGSFFGIIH